MIAIRHLEVALGGRPILRGIDLALGDGGALALVGPNGAGKTTVLRAVTGLVRYRGDIRIGPHDARREPVAARRLLGYMPQVPAFCEETAAGALAFVAALRGTPSAEVPLRLRQVGLADHARRRIRTFSTGMKQRLSLAAALIGEPRILVLDEPTASLDLRGQAELIALLRELRGAGRTLLLSSHRAEEIRALADSIVVLDEGRVVAAGGVDEIAPDAWLRGADSPPELCGAEPCR